jgi:hypothetical protein
MVGFDISDPLSDVITAVVGMAAAFGWSAFDTRRDRRLIARFAEVRVTTVPPPGSPGRPRRIICASRVAGMGMHFYLLLMLTTIVKAEFAYATRWYARQRELCQARLAREAQTWGTQTVYDVHVVATRLGRFRPRSVLLMYGTIEEE